MLRHKLDPVPEAARGLRLERWVGYHKVLDPRQPDNISSELRTGIIELS